jgi:hypothetical protein
LVIGTSSDFEVERVYRRQKDSSLCPNWLAPFANSLREGL